MNDTKENLPDSVSIIIPVRNGGEYIKECIGSIMQQTDQDFNLIILDNASTDGTVQWIRELNDPRIRIYESEKSLSIEENWSRIKTVPRNKWMMITGHDDIMAPDYLAVMRSLIGKHPDASLYQSHFNVIDKNGTVIMKCKPMAEVQSARDFFRETLANGGGFMMRSKDYDAVGGIPPYPNLFFADYVLWMELSRISYKATAPEHSFSYRVHESNTSALSSDEKYLAGFDLFVNYLQSLKKNPDLNEVINENASGIISLYCKGLSHRILRTDIKSRNYLTVAAITKRFKAYADLLIDNNTFDPSAEPSVRLARFIDSNVFTRKLFLLFKKIFKKPILK